MQRNGFNIICITASKKIYWFEKNISDQKKEKNIRKRGNNKFG